MAKFKCVHSGCVYEWTNEEMITSMRLHDEYTEVEEEPPKAPVVKEAPKPKKAKGETV